MLLSAALIVRDESRVLRECLASVRGVVDEIVVVDTGSLDDSVEIARHFGAWVIHHPWRDDFAEARNVALDAATGEWILYIDADERLSGATRADVERLLTGCPEVAFRVLLKPDLVSTPYLEYRLWRHDPRIRFAGQIHEKVTPAIGAVAQADGRPISDCELLLTHVGYEGEQTHKHLRNLPLLRAEIPRDPENLFNRHHLARVLDGLGRRDEAVEVLVEAVEVARRRPHDDLGSLVFTDLIRLRRERRDDVAGLLDEARAYYPDNKLLWWIEASVRLAEGHHREALALFDRLIAVDLAALPGEGTSYDARIFGEFAQEARGVCLFRLGRYAEAADAYAEAMRSDPENVAYRSKWIVAGARARTDGEAEAPAPTTAATGHRM